MKLPDNNRIVSVVVLLISFGILMLIVWEQIELYRFLREAAEVGMAVDISPDPLQRNIRIFFALLLSGLALWSRKGANVAIVFAAISFTFIEAINLAINKNSFDTPEPQIHFLAAIMILVAIGLFVKKFHDSVIASLATLYILFEYLFWLGETRQGVANAGVEYTFPNTLLNNIFNGANWWHVFILVLSISLLIWEIIIYVRYLRSRRPGR